MPIVTPDDVDAASGQRIKYLRNLYSPPCPLLLVTTTHLAGNVNCAPENACVPAGSHSFAFV